MTAPSEQAFLLKLLGLAFAYPNEALLSTLRDVAKNIGRNNVAVKKLIAAFEQDELEIVQGEYTRLFINGYPKTPCPPYESVYREQRMLGNASLEVQESYMEWGMTVDTPLSDHLATELEFLSFLASAESEPSIAEEAVEATQHFMTAHIDRWVPQFSNDLQKSATLDVYKQLAALLTEALTVPNSRNAAGTINNNNNSSSITNGG